MRVEPGQVRDVALLQHALQITRAPCRERAESSHAVVLIAAHAHSIP